MCVLHIKPLFIPVDIKHNQRPCHFFNLRETTSSVVTKLRHRDAERFFFLRKKIEIKKSTIFIEDLIRYPPLQNTAKPTENPKIRGSHYTYSSGSYAYVLVIRNPYFFCQRGRGSLPLVSTLLRIRRTARLESADREALITVLPRPRFSLGVWSTPEAQRRVNEGASTRETTGVAKFETAASACRDAKGMDDGSTVVPARGLLAKLCAPGVGGCTRTLRVKAEIPEEDRYSVQETAAIGMVVS